MYLWKKQSPPYSGVSKFQINFNKTKQLFLKTETVRDTGPKGPCETSWNKQDKISSNTFYNSIFWDFKQRYFGNKRINGIASLPCWRTHHLTTVCSFPTTRRFVESEACIWTTEKEQRPPSYHSLSSEWRTVKRNVELLDWTCSTYNWDITLPNLTQYALTRNIDIVPKMRQKLPKCRYIREL